MADERLSPEAENLNAEVGRRVGVVVPRIGDQGEAPISSDDPVGGEVFEGRRAAGVAKTPKGQRSSATR